MGWGSWGVGWRGVWGGVTDLGKRGLVLFAGGRALGGEGSGGGRGGVGGGGLWRLVGTWVGELGGGGCGQG